MGSPIGSPLATPVTVTFNGTSKYAASLQQVIARSVAMASVSLQSIQNNQLDTSSKISAVQSLQATLTSLNNSVNSMSDSAGNNISTNVSDSSVLQATASAGALPGTYTIQVNDPGSFSTAMSSDNLTVVTDPSSQSISTSSNYTLTVGSNTFNIQPSANNLDALAAAINASGAGVQATIINVGGNSTPDYRLALQDTSLGPDALQLNDGTSDLLTTLNTGTDASYTVNGQPSGGISSTSSTVTIAPGLNVTLEGAGTSTVQVAFNPASITNSLTSFVNAFNAVHAELQKSFGQNAGALSGDSTIFSSTQALNAIASYSNSGTGSIQSLSDLGIQFSQDGTLTFDATKISALTPTQLADAVNFLGSASGGGFLASASNTLNGLLDTTTGLLPNEINSLNQQFNDEGTQIQKQQDSINQLQNTLTQQMNAADALLASLDNQTAFLTSLFSTMNANNFAGH